MERLGYPGIFSFVTFLRVADFFSLAGLEPLASDFAASLDLLATYYSFSLRYLSQSTNSIYLYRSLTSGAIDLYSSDNL